MGLMEGFPTLDDKNYEDLIQEARLLIARYSPEWTDHNVHDPGITFIELFAWLAEMQIYQLNQVSDENYLKFLKLVGLYPEGPQPARVDISFKKIESEKTIETGTQIKTEVDGIKIVFETEEDFTLIPACLKSVKTIYDSKPVDNTRANQEDDVYFSAFGEDAAARGTLLLGFDKPFSEKEIQIAIDIFEDDLPSFKSHGKEPEDFIPSAKLAWEYLGRGKWNTLAIKKDTTFDLTRSGRIVFGVSSDMGERDELYWIRCRIKEGHYEIPPRIKKIELNTISAVQIETKPDEDLGTGLEIPEYMVSVKRIPVLKGSQKILIQKENDKAEYEEWKEVEDFELSGPDDGHYVFDHEQGTVVFGNGLNGKIPLRSQKIKACYKTTLGPQGNVPKGYKWQVNKEGFEGIFGENSKEAKGGKAAEPLEQAKKRAKKDCREPYRAITSDDYEKLAQLTAGLRISRAKSIPNYNPDYPCMAIPGAVTVVVVPYTRDGVVTPVPGKGFLQTISRHLEMHRLITTDLYVIGPEYIKVSVKCSIHIKKKYSTTKVSPRVKHALADFLNPLKGGPDKNGWPFGRPVYPSEIYQVIDGVEGVDYAASVFVSAEGKYLKIKDTEDTVKIPPIGLVFSGEHQVEAAKT